MDTPREAGNGGSTRSRITVLDPGLLVVRDVAVISRASVDTMFARVTELVAGARRFDLIVDLSSSTEPTTEVRAHLRARIGRARVAHVAVVTGRNVIINMVVKFVIERLVGSLSVHGTFDAALERTRRERERR